VPKVQRFGHDQDRGGRGLDRGQAALPVRPAPRVGLSGLVGEDHLTGDRVLSLPAKGHVVLVADRVPDLERPGDGGDVEDGDRDGEG
jgi:hypothetical protein